MARSWWHRWLRGVGLSFWGFLLFGATWGPLAVLLQFLDESRQIPESLRDVLVLVGIATMFVYCPLAFEWLTRKLGIVMETKLPGSANRVSEGRVREEQ
jgi:hypothetical protein